MKIVIAKYFSSFSERIKYGILEGLLDRISLGSEDVILLGFTVGASVETSVGSSEIFNDNKFDGTGVGKYLGGESKLYLIVKL